MGVDGGYIIEKQNLSVNDGDGIRTVIFLAGCPLRCRWCANPEGFEIRNAVGYVAENCTHCGQCVKVCPNGVGIELNDPFYRRRCVGCGTCVPACPAHARKRMVRYETVERIVSEVARQLPFFRQSGGGVTFSGGEATMQLEFLQALTDQFYDWGISMALETCAYFDFEKVRHMLEKMDLIFVDIKHMDREKHLGYTGVENGRILSNIRRMRELSTQVVVRVPTIVGVNADDENIRATAHFVKEALPDARIELLPYHQLGNYKYEALAIVPGAVVYETPSDTRLAELRRLIESIGVETVEFK